MSNENMIYLAAEAGSFNSVIHWEITMTFKSNDTAVVLVRTQEKKYETKLVRDQVLRIKEFLSQIKIFDLVSTNYEVDLADDCYHLGITCEYKEDGKRFYHKVPTGPCVVVSATTPTHEQMYRFLHLIINIGEMSENLSGIEIPPHIKLRWTSRSKELIALTQLAAQKLAAAKGGH